MGSIRMLGNDKRTQHSMSLHSQMKPQEYKMKWKKQNFEQKFIKCSHKKYKP